MEANIEGEKGYFHGSVSKKTGSPDGYGVFKTGDWVHCGKVGQGRFTDGRKVSATATEK